MKTPQEITHQANLKLDTLTVPLTFKTGEGGLDINSIRAVNPDLQVIIEGIKPQILLCLASKGFVADDDLVCEPQVWN